MVEDVEGLVEEGVGLTAAGGDVLHHFTDAVGTSLTPDLFGHAEEGWREAHGSLDGLEGAGKVERLQSSDQGGSQSQLELKQR